MLICVFWIGLIFWIGGHVSSFICLSLDVNTWGLGSSPSLSPSSLFQALPSSISLLQQWHDVEWFRFWAFCRFLRAKTTIIEMRGRLWSLLIYRHDSNYIIWTWEKNGYRIACKINRGGWKNKFSNKKQRAKNG